MLQWLKQAWSKVPGPKSKVRGLGLWTWDFGHRKSDQALSVRLRIEALETRDLLSASGLPVAQAALQVAPLVTSARPYGYTPAQIRHAYGFDQVRFGNGTIVGDGRGQTIAIIAAYDDPTIASDLRAFDRTFGLPDPPSFMKVNQAGGSTWFPAPSQTWALEISLDVEWAHAIAPGANIVLVEASSGWLGDLLTAVDYARRLPTVSVVSMSWGSGEFWSETYYDSYFKTPAGHQGITFVAASGDSGIPASWPAVSPNVLAVGGTNLYLGAGGAYGSESGWSGSGGSISPYEPQPLGQHAIVSWLSKRTAPDVSYDANPNTGFAVYDSMGYGAWTGWLELGGTSAGAPQWAGLIAIANEGRTLAGRGTLDGATGTLPAIYGLAASDFHDIMTGNNGYNAIRGYDCVTGRGTPLANLVIGGLVSASGLSSYASGNLNVITPSGSPAQPHGIGSIPASDSMGPTNNPHPNLSPTPVVWIADDGQPLTGAAPALNPANHASDSSLSREVTPPPTGETADASAWAAQTVQRDRLPGTGLTVHETPAQAVVDFASPSWQLAQAGSTRAAGEPVPVSHDPLPDDSTAHSWLALLPPTTTVVEAKPSTHAASALDHWAAASLVALGLNAAAEPPADKRKHR